MWLANTPGLIVSILARISIAILLVRLFGVHRWLKWFIIIVTAMCTILTIIILPCTYLQSTPVSGNWDPYTPAKHWDPRIYIDIAFFSQGGPQSTAILPRRHSTLLTLAIALWTFSDLTFVLFPIMVIWRLQMALRQRIGLVLLMSASLFTMVMSILKTVGLQRIADQQADPTATDVQYDATLEILWSCLEQACVIIMGCVPSLRAVTKLELTKSISNSLDSILRRRKSSSLKDQKYESSGVPYDSLEMSTDRLGRADGSVKPPFTAVAMYEEGGAGSQQDLVKKNGILSTTEASVSYSRGWNNV